MLSIRSCMRTYPYSLLGRWLLLTLLGTQLLGCAQIIIEVARLPLNTVGGGRLTRQ